ncbi:MAG: hypothetical protein BWX86_02719 [Verrucomicrobia bacterium ADurb.Bin122]|nr:MAG: hypothetical protein BWX86_02719 [Verrucomicrobia bacterium ADurb.Bin122]
MLRLNTAREPPCSGACLKAPSGNDIHAGHCVGIFVNGPVCHLPLRADPKRIDRLHYWFVDSFPWGAQRTGIGRHFPRARLLPLPFV